MNVTNRCSGTAVCTIISKNYLHYARTLMASLARTHPDWRRYVLLVDARDNAFDPAAEPFTVIEVADLPLPKPAQFLFRYTILEANTAVKPWLLAWLFRHSGCDRVVYLDPDIYVYRPLAEVETALDRGAFMVLTPHLTAEVPDRLKPNETDILRAGCYNLGFLALARHPQLESFLKWWQRNLEFDCCVEFDRGLFVDQKWFDLVPALYEDVAVLKHPGYNVAYWNLVNRTVTRKGGECRVNGQPLVFFHFSGLDPHKPYALSKHQDRFRWTDLGPVRTLIQDYCAAVLANGLEQFQSLKYAYGSYKDGQPILDQHRRKYRKDPGVQWLLGEDPFATGSKYFQEKAVTAAPPSPRVPYRVRVRQALGRLSRSEAVRSLRRSLGPVIHLFPAGLRHRIKVALKRLMGIRVAAEVHDPARNLPPLPSTDSPRILQFSNNLTEGLNIVGYVRSEYGLGESARLCARAARAAGLSFSLYDFNVGNSSRAADKTWEHKILTTNPHTVNLCHINADQMPVAYTTLGADFFAGRYNIGYWHWELPEFPDQCLPGFRCVQEVWVPSEFVRQAISRKSPHPVFRMPHSVHFRVAPHLRRSSMNLPEDRFLFLAMYDTHSVQARKNPQGVIAAFRKAFPDPEAQGVGLVIKINNPGSYPKEVAALKAELKKEPAICIVDRILTRQEVYDLEAMCDCFVSLHRSEGFGLGLAESMFLGKPVIGTHWSGNVDFMTADNSCPVGYQLVTLERDYGPYQKGQVWAEPDLEHAAWYMRRVVADGPWRRSIAARGQDTIRNEFSPEAVGALYKERLAALTHSRVSPSVPDVRVA